MKKLLAIAVAAIMIMSLSVSVFASTEHEAKLMFTANGWYPNLMANDDPAQDNRPTITIDGDGTYSIETKDAAGTAGVLIFCIDFIGMHAEHPDAAVTLDSIEVDGAPYEFDASKILYGDIEENGNYRIEVRNEYGATKDDEPFNSAIFMVKDTLKVTFTVSGLGSAETEAAAETETAAETEAAPEAEAEAEAAPEAATEAAAPAETESAPAAAATSSAPNTGLALCMIPAVIALGAVAVSKKH